MSTESLHPRRRWAEQQLDVGYAASSPPPLPQQQGARGVEYGGEAWSAPVRPLAGLGRATAGLLACQVLAGVAAAAVAAWSALSYAQLSGLPADVRLAPDVAASTVQVLTGALMALTGLVFVIWLFCAARDVQRLGTPLRHDPGWAVAAWFVPFLNLVRPKRIVDDVWRGSLPSTPRGTDVRRLPRPGIVLAWWSSWLLAGALSSVASVQVLASSLGPALAQRRGVSATPVVDFARVHESSAVWSLWASAASVVAACCAIVIVNRVTSWHDLRLRDGEQVPA